MINRMIKIEVLAYPEHATEAHKIVFTYENGEIIRGTLAKDKKAANKMAQQRYNQMMKPGMERYVSENLELVKAA